MRTRESRKGAFQKVGECLYRYSSNGVYYARVKFNGKEVRRTLETTDRDVARRELARFKGAQRQIDRSAGPQIVAKERQDTDRCTLRLQDRGAFKLK